MAVAIPIKYSVCQNRQSTTYCCPLLVKLNTEMSRNVCTCHGNIVYQFKGQIPKSQRQRSNDKVTRASNTLIENRNLNAYEPLTWYTDEARRLASICTVTKGVDVCTV